MEGLTRKKKRLSNEWEKRYITRLLKETCGNVTVAAQLADMDRSNFLRRLRFHELRSADFRPERGYAEEI